MRAELSLRNHHLPRPRPCARHGWAPHRPAQAPRHQQPRIPNRLGIQPGRAEPPHQPVPRVARQPPLDRVARLPKRPRQHQLPQQPLQRHPLRAVSLRQPVEQLGMARFRPAIPQVLTRRHQPRTKHLLPHPVDLHPCGQCPRPRVGLQQPPRQCQALSRRPRRGRSRHGELPPRIGQKPQPSRRDHLAGRRVIPPHQQVHLGRCCPGVRHQRELAGLGVRQLIPAPLQVGQLLPLPGDMAGKHLSRRPRGGRSEFFNQHIVDHKAAVAAVLEAKPARGEIVPGQLKTLFLGEKVDQVFQAVFAILERRDADTIIPPGLIPRRANRPRRLRVGPGIVQVHAAAGRRMPVDQQVPPGGRATVVEVLQGDEIAHPLGG